MQVTRQSSNRKIFDTLRYIAEYIPDAVFAVDSKKVILAWNRIMEKMTGVQKEDVIGQTLEAHIIAIWGRPHQTLIERVLAGDANDGGVRRDGSISGASFIPWVYNGKGAYLWAKASPLRDASGTVIGAIETLRDVTEWKDAKTLLHESEEKHRKLIEVLKDIVYTTDRDGKLTYLSPSIEEIVGYSLDDMIGRPFTDLVSPRYRDEARRVFKAVVGTEKITSYDIAIQGRTGKIIPVEVRGAPLFDGEGSNIGRIGVARDIKERKEAEKKVRESEKLYRTIFETTGNATFLVERDATISLVNTEFEKLSGYSREEIEGKKRWMDFSHEADLEWMLRENKKRKEGDPSARRNYEYRFLTKEGGIRHVFLTISMIPETGRIIASLLDLTEKKQSEMLTRGQHDLVARLNGLARLDEVLKACGEAAMQLSRMDCVGVYLVDEETGGLELIYQSGLSQEFVEQASYYSGNSPNIRLVEKGKPVYCRYEDLAGDSDLNPSKLSERLRSIAIVPIHHEGRMIACLNAASHTMEEVPSFSRMALESITSQVGSAIARVKAREALKKSEEMFRTLAENSFDTILRFDRQYRHLYASPGIERDTGVPSRKFIGKTHRELGFPEELVDCWEGAIRKVFDTGKPNRIEFMLPNGIWIDWLLAPEFDERGDVKAVMTSSRDITERKLQEIREREERDRLERENMSLKSSMKDRWRFGAIIGKSDAMQEVYELIQRAAGSNASVVIYGESGTGKELAARAIHETSSRKGGEFVPVNCGAIPENLLESEFFGHRKGAFTGAYVDTHGYLDLADGGSLFLDEIGDLGMNIQVKLLRALEGGGYTPLGDARVKHSDFRIIAATNRDLADHVRQGIMREDFFYRIHIVPITLPPLRERREDIPLLVEYFLKRSAGGGKALQVPGKIMEALYCHEWPGNVRELQNVLHRYLTIQSLDFISTASQGLEVVPVCGKGVDDAVGGTLTAELEKYERGLIVRMLERKQWHRMKAAEALGISRHTLFRKMKNYELL